MQTFGTSKVAFNWMYFLADRCVAAVIGVYVTTSSLTGEKNTQLLILIYIEFFTYIKSFVSSEIFLFSFGDAPIVSCLPHFWIFFTSNWFSELWIRDYQWDQGRNSTGETFLPHCGVSKYLPLFLGTVHQILFTIEIA